MFLDGGMDGEREGGGEGERDGKRERIFVGNHPSLPLSPGNERYPGVATEAANCTAASFCNEHTDSCRGVRARSLLATVKTAHAHLYTSRRPLSVGAGWRVRDE